MQAMSAPAPNVEELLDLKLLPAWLKEPARPITYEGAEGDSDRNRGSGRGPIELPRNRKFADRASNKPRSRVNDRFRKPDERGARRSRQSRPDSGRERARPHPEPDVQVTVSFLPYSATFENVVAQINSGSVAYSLYALARLFLEKPVGYEVCLKPKAGSQLYQIGENGIVSADRDFLDRNAFRFAQRDFYQVDVVETDPIKGDFSNVARCPLSGTLLGPTNHHHYQPQLRSLYEQRFSQRMSFADYQRQIDIVSDSALIERWKQEARKVTTFTTVREESPVTFSAVAEAERHFRTNYVPGLIRSVDEVTIGGASSRRLPDRGLNRAIEEAWSREARSPSIMMQELANRFRQSGLHVFRHRRGMLFVSPIRPRAFVHQHAGVSPSVNSILEALSMRPRSNRKQVLEKLTTDVASENAEARRLALASDLRWLINEGYVIEFNDGSLDLPKPKAMKQTSEWQRQQPVTYLLALPAPATPANEAVDLPLS